ncbi:MAG: CD225/dispanin family protein [Actinophytocola sp.]|nr:CD225/dispanin family protein [Actinophytocola sp.]
MTNPYPQQPYDPYGQGQGPYGPGMPGPYGPPGPPPDNNLVWGILTTVMCCLPLGIVSIIKANEVNKLWYHGQYEAAHKAASDAGKWAMWSAIASVAIVVIVFVFVIAAGAISFSTYSTSS